MALPLRFNKRSNSRKSTLPQDSPAISSDILTSNLNQNHLAGDTPSTTYDQDPPKDIATRSQPASRNAPTTFSDPSQSYSPIVDKNTPGARPTEAITLSAEHDTGLRGERLKDNPKAHNANINFMQARFTPAKNSSIWDTYVKKAEEVDKDLVDDWDRVIDVTLVFAALFSAISTGFVLESSKNLQIDQSKAAVLAIRDLTSIVQAGINASSGVHPNVPVQSSSLSEDSYQPTKATILVNCLWFLSLGLSISVSLLAMLAKRWCYVFSRGSRRTGAPYERAIERQKTWDAIERWKMEFVIEQLPTLMHVALMLFFFGLVVYLSEIHRTTMIVMAVLVGTTMAVYWFLTVLPVWFPTFPMITPFTRTMLIWRSYLTQLWNRAIEHTYSNGSLVYLIGLSRDTYGAIANLLVCQKPPTMQQTDTTSTSDTSENWIIPGSRSIVNATRPLPPPTKDDQQALCALVWYMNHSKDKAVVQEVLEYINAFPEVILGSSAISDQLVASVCYEAVHQHLKVPNLIDSICSDKATLRLIYMAARPWLPCYTRASSDRFIQPLFSFTQTYRFMSSHELEDLLRTIKDNKLVRSIELVSWIESLAVKMVLGCDPEMGLKISSVLGKSILAQTTSPMVHDPVSNVHLALWWFFLNCASDCLPSIWPCGHEIQNSRTTMNADGGHGHRVAQDGLLTWNYFRHTTTRQSCDLWLTVVGITRILYTFAHYPDHEGGPGLESNGSYFAELINILRSTLHILAATKSLDCSVGELAVYQGTEIRLFKFDSLDYGADAIRYVLNVPVYSSTLLFGSLRNLFNDFRALQDIKQYLRTKQQEEETRLNEPESEGLVRPPTSIEEYYIIRSRIHPSPHIWLSSGLLSHTLNYHWSFTSKVRANFLSQFVPDILFGMPSASLISDSQVDYIKVPTGTNWDSYAGACVQIAMWAGMPHDYDLNAFRDAFQAANGSCMRHNTLWKPLHNAGLIQMILKHRTEQEDLITSSNPPQRSSLPTHANGHWLHIKASLIERLHSFPVTGTNALSPDILEWSIALSDHLAELLAYLDDAEMEMDPEEQTYVIGSLVKLINTLLNAPGLHESPEAPTSIRDNRSPAHIRLEKLIRWGVFKILARPFSYSSPPIRPSKRVPDTTAWYKDLAETIDRLARRFPILASSSELRPPYNDLVAYYKVMKGVNSSSLTLDQVTRLQEDIMYQLA